MMRSSAVSFGLVEQGEHSRGGWVEVELEAERCKRMMTVEFLAGPRQAFPAKRHGLLQKPAR